MVKSKSLRRFNRKKPKITVEIVGTVPITKVENVSPVKTGILVNWLSIFPEAGCGTPTPTQQVMIDTFYRCTEYVLSLPFVTKWEELPDSPGVYFVAINNDFDAAYSLEEVIDYVGISASSMLKRWMGEHSCKGNNYIKIYYLEGEDEHIETTETFFISTLLPRKNKHGLKGYILYGADAYFSNRDNYMP